MVPVFKAWQSCSKNHYKKKYYGKFTVNYCNTLNYILLYLLNYDWAVYSVLYQKKVLQMYNVNNIRQPNQPKKDKKLQRLHLAPFNA